jgi:hypothetical protein
MVTAKNQTILIVTHIILEKFLFAFVSFSDVDSKFILQLIYSKGINTASQRTVLSFFTASVLIPFFSPEMDSPFFCHFPPTN